MRYKKLAARSSSCLPIFWSPSAIKAPEASMAPKRGPDAIYPMVNVLRSPYSDMPAPIIFTTVLHAPTSAPNKRPPIAAVPKLGSHGGGPPKAFSLLRGNGAGILAGCELACNCIWEHRGEGQMLECKSFSQGLRKAAPGRDSQKYKHTCATINRKDEWLNILENMGEEHGIFVCSIPLRELDKIKKSCVALNGFDPPTSGLWAQRAPSAPKRSTLLI